MWAVDSQGARSATAPVSVMVGPLVDRAPLCHTNPYFGGQSGGDVFGRAGMTRRFAILCEDDDGDAIEPALVTPPLAGRVTRFDVGEPQGGWWGNRALDRRHLRAGPGTHRRRRVHRAARGTAWTGPPRTFSHGRPTAHRERGRRLRLEWGHHQPRGAGHRHGLVRRRGWGPAVRGGGGGPAPRHRRPTDRRGRAIRPAADRRPVHAGGGFHRPGRADRPRDRCRRRGLDPGLRPRGRGTGPCLLPRCSGVPARIRTDGSGRHRRGHVSAVLRAGQGRRTESGDDPRRPGPVGPPDAIGPARPAAWRRPGVRAAPPAGPEWADTSARGGLSCALPRGLDRRTRPRSHQPRPRRLCVARQATRRRASTKRQQGTPQDVETSPHPRAGHGRRAPDGQAAPQRSHRAGGPAPVDGRVV